MLLQLRVEKFDLFLWGGGWWVDSHVFVCERVMVCIVVCAIHVGVPVYGALWELKVSGTSLFLPFLMFMHSYFIVTVWHIGWPENTWTIIINHIASVSWSLQIN